MKKFEYLEIGESSKISENETIVSALEKIDKEEEKTLPGFVREIPATAKRKESGDTVTVDYKWSSAKTGNIKIKKLIFKKGEPFEGLYRINIDKEEEAFSIEHKNLVYIFRKTTEDIAKALFEACRSVKASIEEIIGHITTLIGNIYIISKVVKGSWSFDKDIAKGEIKPLDLHKLNEQQKRRLFDLIVEGLVELHNNKLLFNNFTFNNVMLTHNALIFTDLRNLRAARKAPSLVEQFKRTLKYLLSNGLATKEDVYHASAYYCAALSDHCDSWYSAKTGSKSHDSYDVAILIEKEVVSS